MAGSTSEAEAGAFVHWLQGVRAIDLLDKEVHSIEDICDGTVLFDALNHVDGEHFRNPHEDELKDNVVLRIGTLKRLYKLMIQYMAENLQFSTAKLEEPDFDALARINAPSEACKLCRLALIIAVQSDNKMSYVEVIQGLDQGDQQQLMQSIEITRKSLEPVSADEDGDEFLDIRARQPSEELSDVAKSPSKERNNLSLEYRNLVAEHEARGNTIEELEGELAKLQSKMGEITEQLEAEKRKSLHQDQRTEVTRLTEELRKCEDALASAEGEIDRLQVGLRERTRAVSFFLASQKEQAYFYSYSPCLPDSLRKRDKRRKNSTG
ncbi:hypothetical protein K437DRAFT_40724 [Tilletiaria anomala UBC 951]|uniref:HOOK N-terminal domain-containing protein n=1 Tax=Tilletiaria anomala (strain ATCC 24038 / CBS 436.72 / UBC 951) TaxID=1037660 RepID=A0A066WNB5_TILAU|nr:uncharacterized protein K437DRAFT_40724 [Tilletiaria anomala UBC 951]KDN52120.1 hypothetical protein K437DRAFT_40724 [Tilletiaria anomala UBC 951]